MLKIATFIMKWIFYGWVFGLVFVGIIYILYGDSEHAYKFSTIWQVVFIILIGYGLCGLFVGISVKVLRFGLKMIKESM